MFCAKEECQLDVDSARCCVKNALCRTMRCPSGYLARDGAEMFSCQAGHCTVEADLETCCAQDLCANVRCENGGTCTSTDGSCKCAEGFTGSTCAINVDECQGNPCGNHGVCADRVGFYECTCDAGYSGKDCDIADEGSNVTVWKDDKDGSSASMVWPILVGLLSLAGLAGLAGLVGLLSSAIGKLKWQRRMVQQNLNRGVEAVEMHECTAISLVETNPKA